MSGALMRRTAGLLWALALAIWVPLLWAIMALMPLVAHSANVCAQWSATGPDTVGDAPADWDRLPCLPQWLGGTGRGYGQQANASGAVGWLWCPAGSGWTLRFGAGTWADASAAVGEVPAALIASDPRAALKALSEKYTTKRIDDATLLPLWCPHWAAMQAARPADRDLSAWVTPATGSGAAYLFSGTKRTSQVPGVVTPRNAPCDCSVTHILYTPVPGLTSHYCPLAAGPATQVTQCVQP